MSHCLHVRTAISSFCLKKNLFQGFLYALFGTLLLIFSGTFLPLYFLQPLGWLLYLIAFFFITYGLLPYRKLTRLQNCPNEIKEGLKVQEAHLQIWVKGHPQITLDFPSIKAIYFLSDPLRYGVVFQLKNWPPYLPARLKKNFVQIDAKKKKIFCFYFSKRSFEEINKLVFAKTESASS